LKKPLRVHPEAATLLLTSRARSKALAATDRERLRVIVGLPSGDLVIAKPFEGQPRRSSPRAGGRSDRRPDNCQKACRDARTPTNHHSTDSVATSFQFGSRDVVSRAKVQMSVTSVTRVGSP